MPEKSDKNFVKFAISEIKKRYNIDLPLFGNIAGESLAQLYFEYHNIDTTIDIQHIKLFLPHTDESINFIQSHNKENVDAGKPDKSIAVRNMSNPLLTPNEQLRIQKSTISFKSKYLKIFLINHNKEFITNTLNEFDLNISKISINLKDLTLHKSDEFENFLKTRYVSILFKAFNEHTIFRYFDKYGRYKNCQFNIEQELRKFYFTYFYDQVEKDFCLTSIPHNISLNDKSKKALNQYIEVENFSQNKLCFLKHDNKSDFINTFHELINLGTDDFSVLFNAKLFADINYDDFLLIRDFVFNIEPATMIQLTHMQLFNTIRTKNEVTFNNVQNDFIQRLKKEKEIYENLCINKEEENYDLKNYPFQHTQYKNGFFTISRYEPHKMISFKPRKLNYLHEFNNAICESGFYNNLLPIHSTNKFEMANLFLSKKTVNKINSFIINQKNKEKMFAMLSETIFLFNDRSLLNIKKELINTVFKHSIRPELIDFYPFFKDKFNLKNFKEFFELCANRIRYLESNNLSYIIGLFESEQLKFEQFFEDTDILNKQLEDLGFYNDSEYVIEELKYLKTDEFILRQLTTRMDLLKEGAEMCHCVGGANLDDGYLFFSLMNIKTKERTTFSLYINMDEESLDIDQINNKYNKEPSETNKQFVMDLYLQIYDIINSGNKFKFFRDIDKNKNLESDKSFIDEHH